MFALGPADKLSREGRSITTHLLQVLCLGAVAQAAVVPAGTVLEIRLEHPVSTYASRVGSEVKAVLIAPVVHGDRTLAPAGSAVTGSLAEVRRAGLGLVRERARLRFTFDSIAYPGGAPVPIRTRVIAVDNAREQLDKDGRITGVRATGTLACRVSGVLGNIAAFDPLSFMFARTASVATLRFAESEVHFPAGTELMLEVAEAFPAALSAPPPAPRLSRSPADAQVLAEALRQLPYRTVTAGGEKPSDVTNVILNGDADAIERAFTAAGWVEADPKTARSGFRAMRAITGFEEYRAAPMSTLLLGGHRPSYEWDKGLNNFAERHHLRIFEQPLTWQGRRVWAISSTRDTGIAASRRNRNFIHLVDERIDGERAKVVNDLLFTGCVDAVELVPRPWITEEVRNGTGQQLITDRAVAMVRVNACQSPRGIPSGSVLPVHGNAVQRGVRQFFLTLRNDVLRDNLVVTGYSGLRYLLVKKPPKPEQPERTLLVDGEPYVEHPDEDEDDLAKAAWTSGLEARVREAARGFVPPQVEFSLAAGFRGFGNSRFSSQNIGLLGESIDIRNAMRGSWAISPRVTLNSHRMVSHELAYANNAFTMSLYDGANPADTHSEYGAETRRFSYNTLIHVRPPESRLRPYFAVGPALQMVRLEDSQFRKRGGVFRVGLTDFGMFGAAWDFGATPPLEGGGIFQPALEYGAGLKWHVSSRWLLRLDYREVLSSQPDFWTKSYPSLSAPEPDLQMVPGRLQRWGPLIQRAVTIGFGITL